MSTELHAKKIYFDTPRYDVELPTLRGADKCVYTLQFGYSYARGGYADPSEMPAKQRMVRHSE